ncbi:MAG: NADH-quinone oxidoreductase subunit M [Candidatus Kapaibacteriales bacterium]
MLGKDNTKLIKNVALFFSVATFMVSVILLGQFDMSSAAFQFVIDQPWISDFDAGFRIGIDGMSMLMVLLSNFIMPIALLSAFNSINKREKTYYALVQLLHFGMLGVFVSLDLFLFYVFWEVILIPMYFVIGVWGGKERLYASVKFFIYTVVGSLFMLVSIVWLGNFAAEALGAFTTDFRKLAEISQSVPMDVQTWLFLGFALSFLIKVPLFPLHTWLPDAHTEAPTPGSVILAGVLLKMGTYGLIRFNLGLFPEASEYFSGVISVLAVIGIIYGAVVAMVQPDMKRLVAYSSVSHMGFIVLGIFSMTTIGVQGAILQMIAHGVSTGMLFLAVGVLYERRHTRLIDDYGGVAKVMPKFSVFFAIAMFASVGLPGLCGFIGEFLTLKGAFTSEVLGSVWYTVFAASGVIFAAVYLLWMFRRVMYGEVDKEENKTLKDITTREWVMFVPLVILAVWIGVYSKSFTQISEASTKAIPNIQTSIDSKYVSGTNEVSER